MECSLLGLTLHPDLYDQPRILWVAMSTATFSQVIRLGTVVLAKIRENAGLLQLACRRHTMALGVQRRPWHPPAAIAQPKREVVGFWCTCSNSWPPPCPCVF